MASTTTHTTGRTATPVQPTGSGKQSAPEHERIAQRAYEKWCQRGCPHGTDRQDWMEAEAELRAELTKPTTHHQAASNHTTSAQTQTQSAPSATRRR